MEPLHFAVSKNDKANLIRCIDNLKETNLSNEKPTSKSRPFHLASRLGFTSLLEPLLDIFHVDHKDTDDKTALHEAASASQLECAQFLVDHAANIDALKRADWTPLMMACTKDSREMVSLLLDHGASTTLVNKDGWNAFHIASREGNIEILDLLLNSDRSCCKTKSKNLRTPLHSCALSGHAACLNYLLSLNVYNVDSRDSCGNTALMDVCRRGFIDCAKLLRSKAADFEAVDSLGRGLLRIASEAGQIETLKYIIQDLGLRLDSIKDNTISPLHYAVKEGQVETVRFLVESGVNIELKDPHGRTALDVAEVLNKRDCVQAIKLAPP